MALVNKITKKPHDLPDLTTKEFKGKVGSNWESYGEKCCKVYPEISGVAIVTLGKDSFKRPDNDKCEKDMPMMIDVFKKFGFKCITNSNVDCNSLFALIDMLQYIPSKCFHRQFSFYFSGYGGYDRDNGRAYILTKFSMKKESEEKVYLDWIMWMFKQNLRVLEERWHCQDLFCALFFELYLHESDNDIVGPITLPCCDNFVVSISGLNEASISRNANGGKWTQSLSNNLTQAVQHNLPLTAILDLTTKHQLVQESNLSPQYVSLAGQMFFTEQSVQSKYNGIVKQKCEVEHSECSGTLLVVTDSRDEFTKDGDKIMKIFEDKTVNFATIKDTSTVNCNNVIAIIEAVANFAYSQYYKFFAFYYSGYGGYDLPDDGCDPNGQHRVYLKIGDEKVYLDWIVSLYQQRLLNRLPCMLLFELCLQQDDPPPSIRLLSYNNIVIAISGLKKGGRDTDGGIWTRHLCDHINKYDLPITTILDLTQSVLPSTMSPQYVASTGLMYLKKPLRLHDTAVQYLNTLPSSSGTSATPVSDDVTDPHPPDPLPVPVPNDIIDIAKIMGAIPDKSDLTTVLVGIKDDVKKWRELFGKRLLKDAKKSDPWFRNFTELAFLIDEITGKSAKNYKYTWGSVIDALDKPTPIKIGSNRDGFKSVSDVVIRHLSKRDIYDKYMDQLKTK